MATNISDPNDRRHGDLAEPLNKFVASEEGGASYLGDPDHVEALLRVFLSERMEARGAEGVSPAEIHEGDKAAIDRLVDIFLGKNPDYSTIGEWNDEGVIAKSCAADLGIEWTGPGDNRAVMEDVFALFLKEALIAAKMIEDGVAHGDAIAHLETAVDLWKRRLLGIPTFDMPTPLQELMRRLGV